MLVARMRKENSMKKNGEMIAIYSRKSKFTGKGESIGNQVELCKDYVRNMFGEEYTDHCVVFEDEGFSGGNLKRPDFQRMMADVRKHKFRAIVVYRLDRISRNISDFTGLIDELTKLEVSFVSIREQFDTSTPMGRAMMFIISVFSQLERETIAERIRDNMHELAKTGRWLGGNAPTGFKSEGVSKVTVDGKTRKSYKLVPIPEEAEIPKLIFDLYTETDSLTAVEAELLRRRIRTKQGKDFTRFAIKAILQNPVYMVADEDAYSYFTERNADVCFPVESFDGNCGIMAYNRTDQEKGKTTVLLPVSDWIIAPGQHPGLVPSKQWIKVQESLERNKTKGYRKPRSNEALLTGLIYCSCGERMYPKLSQRKTADGEPIYTYVCKMKERSKRQRCNRRNANGNILDAAVIDQLKLLTEDNSSFMTQLEKSRQFYTCHRDQHEAQLTELRAEYAEHEKTVAGLIDSLGMIGDSVAKPRVLKRIEELSQVNREIENRIRELEGLANSYALDDVDFDMLRQMLAVFRSSIAGMELEEKRAAIRTVVRKVIWDGVNAHVVLFGADESDIEFPDMDDRLAHMDDESGEEEPLEAFADVDYGDFAEENSGLGKTEPVGVSKSRWGAGSKCYPHLGDFKSQRLAPQGFKRPAWRILDRLSGNLYVLSQTQNSIVRYAPLFIHSFALCAPRKILEATQFNQRYRRYEEIDNVPDRLRWCRHSRRLMQVEVADKVGMTHSVYKAIEEGFTQHIEPEKVDRLAQFYGVPVTDFLDEFNHFLYDGQAVRIRAYRESFGMGKKP